jgi:hypothetical protein
VLFYNIKYVLFPCERYGQWYYRKEEIVFVYTRRNSTNFKQKGLVVKKRYKNIIDNIIG